MKDVSQNELLSAYLDGELTPAERAQVEQMLAADPAARQLLDELRALSTTLKSLPRHKLGEDLSASVLRIVEKRGTGASSEPVPISMLTEPPATETPAMPLSKTILRRLKNPRVWAWEIAIVAVAVFLLVYNPNQNPNQKVPPAGRAERSIAMAPKPEENQKGLKETPSFRAVESLEFSDSDRNGKLALQKTPVDKIDASGRLSGLEQIVEGPPASAPTSPARGKDDLAKSENKELGDKVALKDMPAAMAAKPAQPPAEEKLADQKKVQAEPADELLVVQCEITPEAVTNRAFDKLLASNGIVWSDAPVEGIETGKLPENETMRLFSRADTDRPATKLEERDKSAAARDNFGYFDTEALKPEPAEIVYVEASPAQIEATLHGLSAQSREFRTVSITPATDGSQMNRFRAGDNRRGELLYGARGGQFKATETDEMAEGKYKTSPESGSATVTNAVMGRAQRLPSSLTYSGGTLVVESADRKQNTAYSDKQSLPEATGLGTAAGQAGEKQSLSRATEHGMVTGRAGEPATGGYLGVTGGAASSPAMSAGERFAPPARTPLAQAQNQPAAADTQQPPATLTAPLPPTPAQQQIIKGEESAKKAKSRQEAEDYSRLGTSSIAPSGQSAPQRMQRALFVFQVIGRENSAKAAEKAANVNAAPANASSTESAPAEAAPADANRDKK